MFPLNVAAYPTTALGLAGLWSQFLFMCLIYSYPLWKENLGFRFAEHTFIALSLAVTLVVTLDALIRTQLHPLFAKGQVILIIPVILGFAMYLLLHPTYRWVSRYPIGILVGSALGMGLSSRLIANISSQMRASMVAPLGGTGMEWFNFSIISIGTVLVLLYFLLTYEHVGVLGPTTKIARYFIMAGLGAHFGNTVLFRFTMLSGRAQFVLQVLGLFPL
jgi:hypothetical protein